MARIDVSGSEMRIAPSSEDRRAASLATAMITPDRTAFRTRYIVGSLSVCAYTFARAGDSCPHVSMGAGGLLADPVSRRSVRSSWLVHPSWGGLGGERYGP